MKRSKTLFVSNVLATIYSLVLIWKFGGAVIEAGGLDAVEAVSKSFSILFDLFEILEIDSGLVGFIYTFLILLCVHIALFALGSILGWLSYLTKKSGGAKFGAVLFLLAMLCFPIFLFFAFPIVIVSFIGAGKQKKISRQNAE